MKKSQGYSMIELVITLSIITLLLSYAIPNLYELKLNVTMNSERNRLSRSLNFARYEAIIQQKHVIICPSSSGNDCDNQSNWHQGWMIFIDDNKNRKRDDQEKIFRIEDPMKEDLTALSSIHRQKIRFNTMGLSPGTNVSINFCDPRGSEFAKSIIINNAGRIKQSLPIHGNVCN